MLRLGVGAALLIAGLGVVAELRSGGHPDGDPGGRILRVLESARSALPPGAHISINQAYEPRWDSCDGMAGTFGYDAAYLGVTFQTSLAPTDVIQHAVQVMKERGWVLRSASADASHGATADWQERLHTGKVATAEIVYQTGVTPTDWEVHGAAPPAAGGATRGC